MNKNPSVFRCEFCELTKHHRAHFPPQPYHSSHPFTLIHSDVRGPSRITTLYEKRWFITFIDDHTDVDWEGSVADRRLTSGYCIFLWAT